jgi:cobalt-zinc-cadmium efflux system membrane fusion protein
MTVLEPQSALRTQEAPSNPQQRGTEVQTDEPAFLAMLVHSLPTALVLLALALLAYWGHQTGWRIPRFSALTGNSRTEKDDWCEEHGIPESECVECNPELLPRPPAYGWCKQHGVQDCPLEHPDVAQLLKTAQVARGDLERAQRALEFADRPANNGKCKLHSRRLQFASQEALDKAGVKLDNAWRSPVEESVPVNGEVTYDQTRVSPLATPVPGRIWSVEVEEGRRVTKGQVLALVDAVEVGKAKTEFSQALAQVRVRNKTMEGIRPLHERGSVSEVKYREAEAALAEAEIRLVGAQQALANLGLPIKADDVRSLTQEKLGGRLLFLGLEDMAGILKARKTTNANLIPVKAPRAGVVVMRRASVGEVVEPSKTLFVVAEPERMWLKLQVRPDALKPFRQTDPKLLLKDKTVHFLADGAKEEVTARVVWVSTAMDEKARTLEVRADLANPGGRVRANAFGAGRIVLREEKAAVVVPSVAVQWDGNCHVLFVWDRNSWRKGAPKVFHVRSVRVGTRYKGQTEIIAGVLPGEVVAARGSSILRAELLKANLGEG